MATDYDAPRKTDDDDAADSIEELKSRRVDKSASSVDVDETEHADGFELPGADLSGEELSVRVVPAHAASWCIIAGSWPRKSTVSRAVASAPPERDPLLVSGVWTRGCSSWLTFRGSRC